MYQNFVSKKAIDDKKKKRKVYFDKKLKEAQSEYDAIKKKKIIEEERGDSSWILPSLSRRLEKEEEEGQVKKKKKKKDKHKSKKHKHKRGKIKRKNDRSSEESEEWEEAAANKVNMEEDGLLKDLNGTENCHKKSSSSSCTDRTLVREDWMYSPSILDLASTMTSSRTNKTKERKLEQRQKEEKERKMIQESRELNPYMKNEYKESKERSPHTIGESTKDIRIGDGGRSWIEKAYERAVQQSETEGVPLEDIVRKRWGSMEKLNALLKTVNRTKSSTSEVPSSRWRKVDKLKDEISNSDNSKRLVSLPSSNELNSETQSTLSNVDESSSSSENEGEESAETKIEEMRPLSEKEKNELGAKILRAEIMGDDDLASKLRSRLESGVIVAGSGSIVKKEKVDSKSSLEETNESHVAILTRQDKHGNLYPVKLNSDIEELNKKTKGKKKMVSTHDADGKRIRFFEDDDDISLQAMAEQERLTSASDHLAMISRLAGKHLGSAQGDDYTIDDMFVTASATKGSSKNDEKGIKEKAIAEHKQREKQLSTCRFCFENSKIAKHLIISVGKKSYLAVPINASLTSNHCIIIPMNHVVGQTFYDEDVIEEVKIFKRALVKMFNDMDEDIIFLETCKYLRHQNHGIIECIPVPKEIGDMAPIYFKKALMECESEWAQNKKVIDISSKDGIYSAIPKGLPYFAVEFGNDGGFAHIIEEEESFQYYFGKEIIGGMMDLEARLWRKPPKESFEQHKKKVLRFAEHWKQYDWTRKF